MKALHKFLSLPPTERRLVLAAVLMVAAVRCALWLLPSRTIIRKVKQLAAETTDVVTAAMRVNTVLWAVEAVSRRVPGASCLTQAIAGQLLLRKFGYASRLCVGVARGAKGDFRAHAWLERHGQVVIGDTADAYTPLSDFPGRQISRRGNR